MKKTLAVLFGLFAVLSLTACNNKSDEEPQIVDFQGEVESETIENNENGENNTIDEEVNTEDIDFGYEVSDAKKTSLTVEDLENLDLTNFPAGYSYDVYKYEGTDLVVADSGEFRYEGNTSLLPIYEKMTSREVVSSGIEDGMIYTVADITLEDGSTQSLLYINSPETLDYFAASLSTDSETTLYQFIY